MAWNSFAESEGSFHAHAQKVCFLPNHKRPAGPSYKDLCNPKEKIATMPM